MAKTILVNDAASRQAKLASPKKARASGASKKKGGKTAQGTASRKATTTSKKNACDSDAAQLNGGNAAVGRMNDALSREYADIKKLLNHVETRDVQARYDVAYRYEKVRNGDGKEKKYGAGAVKKLADALQLSKSTINDYANVAQTWPQKRTFVSLAKKKGKFGKNLSWSHFVLIATAKDAEQREKLLDATLKNGWSVEYLKSGGRADDSADAETATPQPTLPRTLAVATSNYLAQLETAKRNAEVFSKEVDEGLRASSAQDLTDDLLENFRQARRDMDDFHQSVCAEIDDYIKRVEQRRKSAKH